MTWTIEPDAQLQESPSLRRELEALIEGFTETLAGEASLAEQLPAYRRDLPYYQRMLATGLGTSLRHSLGENLRLDAPARVLLEAAGEGFAGRLLGRGPSRG